MASPPNLWRPTKQNLFACDAKFWDDEVQNRRFALIDHDITYAHYRSLRQYQLRRQPIMDRAGGACEGCGKRDRLEVHHLHYQTMWAETPDDLVAVCKTCHDRAHGIKT